MAIPYRTGQVLHSVSATALNSEFISVKRGYSGGLPFSKIIVVIPDKVYGDCCSAVYVRIRIRKVPVSAYSHSLARKDNGLLSSSTVQRIVDFRVNVRRGVPDDVLNCNDYVEFPRIRKIHCFFVVRTLEECQSPCSEYVGYRSLLDERVWNGYVGLGSKGGKAVVDVSNYLGHQWTVKDEGGVKDLGALGRFSCVDSGHLRNLRFSVVVILLGAAGSASWELLSSAFSVEKSADINIGFSALLDYFLSLIGSFSGFSFGSVSLTKVSAWLVVLALSGLVTYWGDFWCFVGSWFKRGAAWLRRKLSMFCPK